MTRSIIELSPGSQARHWTLQVPPSLCAGSAERPFLFGGSGMAVCIAAMEAAERRPPTWVTAQYLAYALPHEDLTIEVAEAARGRNTVQLLATARVGDRAIVTAQAAAGERPGQIHRQLVTALTAPPPQDCPQVAHGGGNPAGVNRQFEFRLVHGRFPTFGAAFGPPGDGRLAFWIRPHEAVRLDACLLAIVADFVSDALNDAAGQRVHASSIDNTLRFGPIEDSDWLLCEITVEMLHGGVGHGSMRIYSQGGLLMALASTSLILRTPRAPDGAANPTHQETPA